MCYFCKYNIIYVTVTWYATFKVQVRYTGDWSSNSKLSSIASGYWEDPFLSFFNKVDPVPRRTSLICRGYYVRFRVCDFFMRSILEATEEPIQASKHENVLLDV